MENLKSNCLTLFKLVFLMILLVETNSCKDRFLDYKPKGIVNREDINNPTGAEKLVTAAYASLGNDARDFSSYSTNWLWGNIRSDDAYKGGGSVADGGDRVEYEVYSSLRPDNLPSEKAWKRLYQAISRCNKAILLIKSIDKKDYPEKIQREAEMRFLRGHFYFRLVIIFKNIPWIDETVAEDDYLKMSNRKYTRDELLNKIAKDFQFAKINLPDTQDQVGRASAVAAAAYLARTRLYQAYEENKQNDVTNINRDRLQEVVDETNYVINSGTHSLFDDYAKNFMWKYENGTESIFAIQYSRDDGTPQGGRLDYTHSLVYNMSPKYGCCWFNVPSYNMVNAFKTGSDGLPLFDGYNNSTVKDSIDFINHTFDPRLDHTVGIPGHPFKYEPNFIYQKGWARSPSIYGPYSDMKNVVQPDCPCYKSYGPFHTSSKNYDILRYDDIILMKAEALIQLGHQDDALPLINMIRNRAANSTQRLRYSDGSAPTNYHIEPYKDGVNMNWTKKNAMKTLLWERRLEFGGEGWRFFDLVRWGIADETLNKYLEKERTRVPHLDAAHFQKNKHEYAPIPEAEIVKSEGLYKQNPGY